jgi:uncharacterized protein (TIGR02996 family)
MLARMPARNTELEEQIFADPSDPSAYLVYADWLQAQNDPRGELIMLHHRDGDAAAFIAEHKTALLGRFADETPETFQLTWRLGFVQKATIGWQMFGSEDNDDTSADQLAAFLALDSARFIEALHLGPTPDEEELDLGKLAAVLDDAKPRALRELYLGDTADWDISSTSTAMPDSAAIRELRVLELRGGSVALDEQIDLPKLTKFSVESGSLTRKELVAIANARWPELASLEIWFGDPEYGATGGVADIALILAGRGLAKLHTLRLRNCPFADELAAQLIDAPIVRQIHTLDLSMGNLSDRGVAAMLASRAAFAHLDKLVLDDNALTDAHWPAARALAKTVEFGNKHHPQRAVPRDDDDRYGRYVTVGE